MKKNIPDIMQGGKRIYFLLRSDPDATLQLRQLVLAVCICFAAGYAAHIMLVEPKLAALSKKIAHVESVQNSSSTNESILLSAQLYTQQQELDRLDHSIAVLTLKETLLREQWQHQGSNDLFHQIIFTLESAAPQNMEPYILKMSQGETRSMDGFDLYPVHLEGHCFFNDFYRYLHYLEESPEIGFLDSLELTALPTELSARAEVSFQITLGRLEISHDL